MNEEAEILSQVERAKKLFDNLKEEMNKNINSNEASLEVRNLTEEIFVKLRICLDKLILFKLRKVDFSGDLSKVYFPISKNLQDFNNIIKKYGLDKLDYQILDLIKFFQPFSPEGNKYLYILHEKGAKEKHHFLIREKKETIHTRTTFQNNAGGAVSWTPKGVIFGEGVFMNGVPINPQTQEPAYVLPNQKLIRHYEVLFKLEGYDIELIFLIISLIDTTEKIVKEILK
mgnify:CR=1 FL=1